MFYVAPQQYFHHLALLSLAVLIVGLVYLVRKWPKGTEATFSRHAATNHASALYYAFVFVVALPLLAMFVVCWLVPTYNLPGAVVWLVLCSIVLQHIVTAIPEFGGWRTAWHRVLTGISAGLLIPLVALTALTGDLTALQICIVWSMLVTMLAVVSFTVLNAKMRRKRHALVLQAAYYGAFYIVLLSLAYR